MQKWQLISKTRPLDPLMKNKTLATSNMSPLICAYVDKH